MGHLLMENRHGLVVDARLTHATGTAEREAAASMLEHHPTARGYPSDEDARQNKELEHFPNDCTDPTRSENALGDLPAGGRVTVGGDKLFDTQDFVAEMRRLDVTPHVAQHTNARRSAIDRRTTRHAGYAVSQRIRKRIEEAFGWMKTVGGLRKTRHRGTARVGWQFILTAAAYNLVRIPKLLAT